MLCYLAHRSPRPPGGFEAVRVSCSLWALVTALCSLASVWPRGLLHRVAVWEKHLGRQRGRERLAFAHRDLTGLGKRGQNGKIRENSRNPKSRMRLMF